MADRKSFWLFMRFGVMAIPSPSATTPDLYWNSDAMVGQEMFETTMKESEGGLANANELPEFL